MDSSNNSVNMKSSTKEGFLTEGENASIGIAVIVCVVFLAYQFYIHTIGNPHGPD
jgi:hypothetical protein